MGNNRFIMHVRYEETQADQGSKITLMLWKNTSRSYLMNFIQFQSLFLILL